MVIFLFRKRHNVILPLDAACIFRFYYRYLYAASF